MAGRELGIYTLMEHLGTGGMASVFRASDSTSSRIVAVKIFEPNENRPPEMARRLRDREVRMLVSVQHPNIVTFYDMGEDEENHRYYYSMEFVENSLLKRMRSDDEPDFSLLEKVIVLRQTASALVAMHHQGIVHRDIKPGNILLDQDPGGAVHVKITDLGISKSVSETDIAREQMPTKVPGTAKYLPPEQIRLEPVDGRADIFSLGVTAYELLTGQTPFKAESSEEYLKANIEQTQKSVCGIDPDIPDFLGAIVDRMLAKDREDRYDSDTLARDLQLVQQHLVSGAQLVDRVNPVSMFYEGPELDRTEQSGLIEITRHISTKAYLAAVGMLLAALVLGMVLWPRGTAAADPTPEPAGPDETARPRDEDPRPETPGAEDPAELLQDARIAILDENIRYALALVERALSRDMPTEQRAEARELQDELKGELAKRAAEEARALLDADRLDEAMVLVQSTLEVLDDAPDLERVRLAVQERRRQIRREKTWRESLARAEQLRQKDQYQKAVEQYTALMPMTVGDPDKRELIAERVSEIITAWTESIREAGDAEAARQFLAVHAENRAVRSQGPGDTVLAELHLVIAEDLREQMARDPELHDKAREQYRAAARLGNRAQARRARGAIQDMQEWMERRETEQMLASLKEQGLASKYWATDKTENTTARTADGVLQLRAEESPRQARVEFSSARPLKRGELRVEVKMRPVAVDAENAGTFGMELRDDHERFFRFYFDGDDYRINVRGAGAPIQEAFGNEATRWHTMALHYDPLEERVTVLIDGEQIRTFGVELLRPRVILYLEVPPNATGGADLKDFKLEH